MGGVVVLTKEQAEARVQELLAQARVIMDEVTELSKFHGLTPSFMEMTFHHVRQQWGDSYRLLEAQWYHDDYWSSSTADCEIGFKYEGEEP